MLNSLITSLPKMVTPVTPYKIDVLPLQAMYDGVVTPVTPVTPKKTISEIEIENSVIRDPFDDRRYCWECRNLSNRRCVKQRFKPVDDVPRRCADFKPKHESIKK